MRNGVRVRVREKAALSGPRPEGELRSEQRVRQLLAFRVGVPSGSRIASITATRPESGLGRHGVALVTPGLARLEAHS